MPLSTVLPGDLAHCRALLQAGSKSFSWASKVLPARVREPATVLYAFCRVADDAIDSNPDATLATVGDLGKRVRLMYAGSPEDHPVDRAMAVVVERQRIPKELLDALIDGFAWDATGRTYETLEDLHAYAARVAGTVGAMMTVIMGARDPSVLARACDLGVAMQLTNIARDVGEDAARGRIYLPLEWMREEGLDTEGWLARPVPDAPTRRVVARLLAAAERLYAQADLGVPGLPRDCRIGIRAARLIYSDIGPHIARLGFDSVSHRAVVCTTRKLWLFLRALTPRRVRREGHDTPPLASTRFLVEACCRTS